MSIVHEHLETSRVRNRLETARYELDRAEHIDNPGQGHAERTTCRNRGERVADVEPAQEIQLHSRCTPGADQLEHAAALPEADVLRAHGGVGAAPEGEDLRTQVC